MIISVWRRYGTRQKTESLSLQEKLKTLRYLVCNLKYGLKRQPSTIKIDRLYLIVALRIIIRCPKSEIFLYEIFSPQFIYDIRKKQLGKSPSQIATIFQVVGHNWGVGKNYEQGCRTITCASNSFAEWLPINQLWLSAWSYRMRWIASDLSYQCRLEFC